jgi:hypothetical protein
MRVDDGHCQHLPGPTRGLRALVHSWGRELYKLPLSVAAQAEFESKIWMQSIFFVFQALSARRFQRGFDRVNLHRPTSPELSIRNPPSQGVVAQVQIESEV